MATISQGGQPWAFLSKKRHWLVGSPYADFSPLPDNPDTFYLHSFLSYSSCAYPQSVMGQLLIVLLYLMLLLKVVVTIRDFKRQTNS